MPFAVRVHIIEGRDIKGVEEGDGLSDPFVLVTVWCAPPPAIAVGSQKDWLI